MAPLPVKKACLKCHEAQGYNLGDIRGGISVTILGATYIESTTATQQNLIIIHLIVFLGAGIGYVFFWRYRENQMLILESKNLKIEESNKNIMLSIRYAFRIQNAILPADTEMTKLLKNYFVIFKPRDVVSGDFYWLAQSENAIIVAVVDCTGHGVPGAFLTMIGDTLLRKIVTENKVTNPALILERLNEGVQQALKQDDTTDKKGQKNDGMDICVCKLGNDSNKLLFAGAKRPLIHIRAGKINEIPGDRLSVGGRHRRKETARTYSNNEVIIQPGDTIYLFSDGYVDQQDSTGKRIGTTRLMELLQQVSQCTIAKQKQTLLSELEAHQGQAKQLDDITMLGIQL